MRLACVLSAPGNVQAIRITSFVFLLLPLIFPASCTKKMLYAVTHSFAERYCSAAFDKCDALNRECEHSCCLSVL